MISLSRRRLLAAAASLAATSPAFAEPADPALEAAIASPRRSAAARARDAWRHPAASLRFWGLRPGMTVVDIQPGGGWWTDILAPYLAATGGRYIAAAADLDDPATRPAERAGRASFAARYGADPALAGHFAVTGFGPRSGPLAPAGTVDLVLVSRMMHDWLSPPGFIAKALADMRAALKPGGSLAVEEHRARLDADPAKGDGYLPEAFVIGAVEAAGFQLAGRSEINANPLDTKDHPFGVWTLPPTRRSAPSGQPANPAFDHAPYDAIGESDRMTLRFVKPA